MKKIILAAIITLVTITGFTQTKWTVDPMHSFVSFSVGHLGISLVDGSFKKFEGSYTAAKTDLSDININFTADVNSIHTDVEARDNHLKTDDFFNAEKYPAITFTSTSFKKVAGKNYILTGKLTIRDVTKTVKFNVVYGGVTKDNSGNTKSGFKATTVINRLDYGVKYDPTGLGIAKNVTLNLNLEFAQAK